MYREQLRWVSGLSWAPLSTRLENNCTNLFDWRLAILDPFIRSLKVHIHDIILRNELSGTYLVTQTLESSRVKTEKHQFLEVMSDSGAECMASYYKTNTKHTSNAVIAVSITGPALSLSSRFTR